MSEVHIIAIFYPNHGKVERMKEVLTTQAKNVHEKEDYTLRYMMTEQIDTETPDIVMIETYNSKEASEQHTREQHFKDVFAAMDGEKLMAKPPYLAFTKTKAGFDLDRNFV